jgi:hypothetical protein
MNAARDPARIARVNTYDISTDPSRLRLDAIPAWPAGSDGIRDPDPHGARATMPRVRAASRRRGAAVAG